VEKATYQAAEIITSEERWEQVLENGSVLNTKARSAGRAKSDAANRLVKCHSTAEQEAVATWPIHLTQLLSYISSL
jgi:hypothetical protein